MKRERFEPIVLTVEGVLLVALGVASHVPGLGSERQRRLVLSLEKEGRRVLVSLVRDQITDLRDLCDEWLSESRDFLPEREWVLQSLSKYPEVSMTVDRFYRPELFLRPGDKK